MCHGSIQYDLSLELAFSHCTFNSLENINGGPISTGWVEHSNSSGTWSVPRSIETCSSAPKLWAVESTILKLIFSKRSLGSTPPHIARILSIASFSCARFSLLSVAMCRVGNALNFPFVVTPCTMNDPTPLFFEPSSRCYDRLIWCHYFIDNAFQCICSNSLPCLSDAFGTQSCIDINTCWALLVVFPLSAKHFVGDSYHSWNSLLFGAVVRADEFVNSSIEFTLYSFDGLSYMAKFFWDFVRGSLHNIRDASSFYGSWDIFVTIWYPSHPSYIASSVSSSLVAVLSLGCSSDGTSFYGVALGWERSSFFFILS